MTSERIKENEITIKKEDSLAILARWALVRTILNLIVIISDTIPVFAIPASILEGLNVASVLANRVGIKIPSLTPNISNGVLGAGIVSEVFDSATLEVLPFPSSLFIHGAQILHDIPHIHNYVKTVSKYEKIVPLTRFLNNAAIKLVKTS